MDAADLEDFFAAQAQLPVPVPPLFQVITFLVFLAEAAGVPAVLDIAEQFDAELVGVDARAMHGERAAMVVGIVDHLGGTLSFCCHYLCMPVAGPPFVDYFCLSLRGEVVGLVADNLKDVSLPGFQRGIADQE